MNKTTLNSQKEKHSMLSLRRATALGGVFGGEFSPFLSTLSLRRATAQVSPTPGHGVISIHALLAESDLIHIMQYSVRKNFYPRSPCGERPIVFVMWMMFLSFLSTLSLRRATSPCGRFMRLVAISIHALLAESDMYRDRIPPKRSYFYPRSPCGERHMASGLVVQLNIISIHALLAESDCFQPVCVHDRGQFLSTLSLRRATRRQAGECPRIRISIHALLAESDHRPNQEISKHRHFYPRSPCGERRLIIHMAIGDVHYFYPRSPCGERHNGSHEGRNHCHISIHALLAESDVPWISHSTPAATFLSTLSLRRATKDQIKTKKKIYHFYPRSPCGERRGHWRLQGLVPPISIHALLAESDAVQHWLR